jgi:hypothetical protein
MTEAQNSKQGEYPGSGFESKGFGYLNFGFQYYLLFGNYDLGFPVHLAGIKLIEGVSRIKLQLKRSE